MSGDTVPSGTCVGGEVWTCQITADDGEDDGPPGEDEVTIGGAYLQDDFTVDYGWDMGSSSGYLIQDGQLEWTLTYGTGEIMSFEIEPLSGGFVLEFDIRVESMTEHPSSSGYGLYLGLLDDLTGSEGLHLMFSDCGSSCDEHDWRFTGMSCGDNCGYGASGYAVFDVDYHVISEFEPGYFSSSARTSLYVYDSSGALVLEHTSGTGDSYEHTFRYLYIGTSTRGTRPTSICCDGSGIIDNLEVRAWE